MRKYLWILLALIFVAPQLFADEGLSSSDEEWLSVDNENIAVLDDQDVQTAKSDSNKAQAKADSGNRKRHYKEGRKRQHQKGKNRHSRMNKARRDTFIDHDNDGIDDRRCRGMGLGRGKGHCKRLHRCSDTSRSK